MVGIQKFPLLSSALLLFKDALKEHFASKKNYPLWRADPTRVINAETHLSVCKGARTMFVSGMSTVGLIDESPVRASSSASVEVENPSMRELLW